MQKSNQLLVETRINENTMTKHDQCKPVALNIFWPMDHLLIKISNGPLCQADTS